MPGTFSPPSRVSDTDMHHGTCVTHVPWCMSGSLTNGFLWGRWRGKRSRHSRRMRNTQCYVSGKRSMATILRIRMVLIYRSILLIREPIPLYRHMRVIATQITDNRLFNSLFRLATKDSSKHYCNFCERMHRWLTDFSHKGPAMQKPFPCHDFITRSRYCSHALAKSDETTYRKIYNDLHFTESDKRCYTTTNFSDIKGIVKFLSRIV